MEPLKQPPRIKVLEAAGAVADGRVQILSDTEALVTSSEGDRVYRVRVDLGKGLADSDDNGTRFRGYVGYPIIAFLMLRGVLPLDREISEALKGVRWRRLNERFKSYSAVEKILLDDLRSRAIPPERVEGYVRTVMEALKRLGLARPGRP